MCIRDRGRVAEIVNARGTQRREIFEEAAGISLFLQDVYKRQGHDLPGLFAYILLRGRSRQCKTIS